MNIRGKNNRSRLVGQYNFTPIGRVKLLPWQNSRKSAAGGSITDECYEFSYRAKSGSKGGTLYCGSTAAQCLLSLLGQSNIPLFDPFVSSQGGSGAAGQAGGGASIQWDPVAKELFNAICVLSACCAIKIDPSLPIGKIKGRLLAKPSHQPSNNDINHFNNIINTFLKGKTLTAEIQAKANRYPNAGIQPFNFNNLTQIVAQSGNKSYY